jgi:hypothetical protein
MEENDLNIEVRLWKELIERLDNLLNQWRIG